MKTCTQETAKPTLPVRQSNDAELARRIHNFFVAGNIPGLRRLGVEVHGESVILTGCVKTFYEKQLAAAFCRRVAGVHSVRNDVTVEQWVRRSNAS